MTDLGEMRKALEAADPEDGDDSSDRPKRQEPQNRGVAKSRSMVMEVDLPGNGKSKKGTLTFANSVGELKRSGMSRRGSVEFSRSAPRRAQSCIDG